MNYNKLQEIELQEIPKISDPEGRGNLSIIEKDFLPYKIKRVYYLYDVPSDSSRGGHAHKDLQQFLIALSGSFDVVLDEGNSRRTITLNRPNKGLLIPNGIWRELDNFSSGSISMVLSSDNFEENDYLRNYSDFIKSKN